MSEIKLLIQQNSRPQDLIVYTDGSVTKDQSGWGYTVKQCATTIDKDRAAYMVSISSLTMEAEAVTHDLRWIASRGDIQTTHAIILIDSLSLLLKVKSGMGSPECKKKKKRGWSTSTFKNSCGRTALDMQE